MRVAAIVGPVIRIRFGEEFFDSCLRAGEVLIGSEGKNMMVPVKTRFALPLRIGQGRTDQIKLNSFCIL